jgi:hypothetical protein
MARHCVTACCDRYRQCNKERICRKCMRLALQEAAERTMTEDDLSYYDTPGVVNA